MGIPSLSSQVFSNGHAAAFASTRINRDGTVVPDTNAEMAMAMLLREERAKLDREAIAAGLGYRGVPSNYMDPRVRSIQIQKLSFSSCLSLSRLSCQDPFPRNEMHALRRGSM